MAVPVAMQETLTERWSGWVRAARESCFGDRMPLYILVRKVVPDLLKLGYMVPERLTLQTIMEQGAEPLSNKDMEHGENWIQRPTKNCCSFAHVLNLVWVPVLEYMDSCTSPEAPVWTKALGNNHTALVAEMTGIVSQV